MTVDRSVSVSTTPSGTEPKTTAVTPALSTRRGFMQDQVRPRLQRVKKIFCDYAKFIGPGFMISVAYSMYSHLGPSACTTLILMTNSLHS